MKVRNRSLSVFLTAVVLCGVFGVRSSARIVDDRSFHIHGKTVERTSVPHMANCWDYANAIYTLIWGKSFGTSYKGDRDAKNMLYGLSDDERLITAEHTKKFIQKAKLGSVIRITNAPSYSEAFETDYLSYGGKVGHCVILTDRDDEGFWCLEDWRQMSLTSYYRWDEFGKVYNIYTYYKYIKAPDETSVKKKKKPAEKQAADRTSLLSESENLNAEVHTNGVFTFAEFDEVYKYRTEESFPFSALNFQFSEKRLTVSGSLRSTAELL